MDADITQDFTAYVEARSAAWFRTALAMTGHRQEAEDLLQTVLTNALRHWRRIREGNPDAYLRQAMYRQQVSWWRKPMRRHERATDRPSERGIDGDLPAHVDTSLALHAALRRLAPKHRAVLVLRYFEDLPDAQIAEILGCKPTTVRSQVSRALDRLRVLCPDLDTLALQEAPL